MASLDESMQRIEHLRVLGKFSAQFYAFKPTGNKQVDMILAAVADAGWWHQHTENWSSDSETCSVATIQEAANRAAEFANKIRPPIGTKIRFTKTLGEAASGDHPEFLYARKGEIGTITGYNDWEGFSATSESNPNNSFGVSPFEFELYKKDD